MDGRRRIWVWLVGAACLLACAAGCSRSSSPTVAPDADAAEASRDPAASERTLYEQCRAGSVQLAGVEGSIEESLRQAESLADGAAPTDAQALKEAADLLDSAGSSIADYSDEVPPFVEFRKSLLEQDERRLKAIEASNDALFDLQNASGVLAGMADAGPKAKEVGKLLDRIAVAVDDLSEAIETLGGKVDAPV